MKTETQAHAPQLYVHFPTGQKTEYHNFNGYGYRSSDLTKAGVPDKRIKGIKLSVGAVYHDGKLEYSYGVYAEILPDREAKADELRSSIRFLKNQVASLNQELTDLYVTERKDR